MNNKLKEITKRLKKANSVAIFTHVSPDFDALGSSFALFYALKSLGKNVQMFSKEKFDSHQKKVFEDIVNHGNCAVKDFDLFVCVDLSSLNRLGEYAYIFKEQEETMIIDHHMGNDFSGKYNYINHNRSSCCEIILNILEEGKIKITPQIASFLFAGLSSDTSSFQNSSTKVSSFESATKLMKYGADIYNINQKLYETRTVKEIAFKKYLWNNYKSYKDCAYCLVDFESLRELKGKKTDCESYSRSLVSIEGINRSFSLIEEKEGSFKVSLRSKIGYDVRSVATKLGGGGHVCASGAVVYAKNIQAAKKMVLDALFEDEKEQNEN